MWWRSATLTSPATIYDLLIAGGGGADLSGETLRHRRRRAAACEVLRKAGDVARSRRYPYRFEVVIPDLLRCQSTVEPRGVVNVAISGPGGTHHWNLGPGDNGDPANVAKLDLAGDRRYRQRALWEWHGTTEDGELPLSEVCGTSRGRRSCRSSGRTPPDSRAGRSSSTSTWQLVAMTGFAACDVIVRDYYADCMYAFVQALRAAVQQHPVLVL